MKLMIMRDESMWNKQTSCRVQCPSKGGTQLITGLVRHPGCQEVGCAAGEQQLPLRIGNPTQCTRRQDDRSLAVVTEALALQSANKQNLYAPQVSSLDHHDSWYGGNERDDELHNRSLSN